MSDKQLVIEPDGYKPRGTVPRSALAGGLIVVVLVASGLYLLDSDAEEPRRPEQQAVAVITSPQSVMSQPAGTPQVVDEAEEAARSAVTAAQRARDQRAESEGLPFSRPAQEPFPLPNQPSPVRRATPETRGPEAVIETPNIDSASAARELASRNVETTIFDHGGSVGGAAQQVASDATSQLRRALRDIEGDGQEAPGAADPLAQLAKVIQGGGARGADAAGTSARSWQQRVSQGASVQALYPVEPVAPLMLAQGSVIPAVTTRQVNSDMPGVLTARVSMDVYDSLTSRRLLVPKGAVLVGEYNESVAFGQDRLQFAFTRLRMPDGSTYELTGATGSDQAGRAGVAGNVDRHFVRTFGSALLLGVLADRVTEISALPRGSAGEAGGGLSATGQVFVDTARAELERMKSTPATIRIPEGTRINVEVVRDMVFPSVYSGRGF